MKRNQKFIIGAVLIIFIAVSGGLVSWFIFFREFPHDKVLYYPDLTISDYSLENDNLTVRISNIGQANSTGVIVLAEIDLLSLTLYNNTLTPVDLEINEVFIFSINLSDYNPYFTSGNTYIINIQVDPNDGIAEESEINNEINVDYLYEGEIPPLIDLFSSNTYCLNSSINTLGYAVVFNSSQIILKDSLIITNGTINGYNVVNSTILDKTNITNSNIPISIALYREQNLTLQNIWDPRISIVLCNNSNLSLYNCSIQQVATTGSNDILISNSSIQFFTSSQNLMTVSSLRIINNSSITYCIISGPTSLEIEQTSIQALYIIVTNNPYTQQKDYLVSGTVKNCSIYGVQSYGQTDLNIYNTDIYHISIMGNTKLNLIKCIITEGYIIQKAFCVLTDSTVLSELNYGIIVYSDSVNITNGIVEGTSYINNTLFINANVSKTTLMSVVVNNTGSVLISNFSCNLFLYDYAIGTITDTNPPSSDGYGAFLEGSSNLIGINSSLGFILCQQNSSLALSEDCMIQSLFINSTNSITMDNSTFLTIGWYSEPLGSYKAEIANSIIGNFYAPPSNRVNIINCSIENLYEGIKFQSGINYYNSSGIFGEGSISNYLNITGSTITERTYKYIEITGDANVVMEDLHNLFSISIDSGSLMVYNCTLESMQMRNNAIVYLDNCSIPESGAFSPIFINMFGPQAVICLGNSHLYINNTKILEGNLMMLYNTAEVSITDSIVYAVYVFQEAKANITYSNLWIISVAASSSADYALNLSHSITDTLLTISWNFFVQPTSSIVI